MDALSQASSQKSVGRRVNPFSKQLQVPEGPKVIKNNMLPSFSFGLKKPPKPEPEKKTL